VKEAVFPFARFPGVDTVLGPEMKSTGEVMGIDRNFAIAFAKSQIGGGSRLPRAGTVFVSVRDADKPPVLEAGRLLVSLGYGITPTSGTQRYRAEQALPASRINKVLEGRPHIVDAIANGGVQLVFNTTEGATALADSRSLRRAALLHKVPYYTTLSGAVAAAQGIKAYLGGDFQRRALQSYFGGQAAYGKPWQADRRYVFGTGSRVAWPDETSARDRNYCLLAAVGGSKERRRFEGTMDKIPMTSAGYTTLENELKHRQQVERPRIIQQITDARTHGDLSENAEYHAAKESQSHNEGRIAELEDKLARAEVIDVSKLSGDTITFGATVTLVDEDTEKKQVWQLVGEPEADAKKGKISITSPLARALIGKGKGTSVEVMTPSGAKAYEIKKVEWRWTAAADAAAQVAPAVIGLAARLVPAIHAFNLTAVQNRGAHTRAGGRTGVVGHGLPGERPHEVRCVRPHGRCGRAA